MLKKTFLAIIIIVGLYIGWKIYENYNYKILSVSPALKEISGIEFDKAGNLWAINDGGNSAEIHQIDSLGNIHRSIRITNAKKYRLGRSYSE